MAMALAGSIIILVNPHGLTKDTFCMVSMNLFPLSATRLRESNKIRRSCGGMSGTQRSMTMNGGSRPLLTYYLLLIAFAINFLKVVVNSVKVSFQTLSFLKFALKHSLNSIKNSS